MPSLIGSGANQVPTNGMLGTMAFQDADNALVQNITVAGSSSVPTKFVTDNSTASASTAFVRSSQKFKELAVLTTGTPSAYVLTSSQGTTEYYFGQQFTVQVHVANANNATINIDGFGARNLVFRNADGSYSNVLANDLTLGGVYILMYNGSNFEVLNRRQATSIEASSGTNTNSLITPAGLRQGLNASGSAPIYACRAWVNFNGTGTVAIKESGNVSSVTDLGTGKYELNFTTALQDVNYSWAGSASLTLASDANRILVDRRADMTKTVSSLAIRTMSGGTAADPTDSADISVVIFR